MDYSRRIISVLCLNCVFITYFYYIFLTGLDPVRPTQDGKFCDPTRPDTTRPMDGPDSGPHCRTLTIHCITTSIKHSVKRQTHASSQG